MLTPTRITTPLRLVLILGLVITCAHGKNFQAEYIRFTHLSVEDGLSHTLVNTINQDNEGFMWFGTEDGLNKFDGYRFEVYRPEPDNTNSLSNASVNSIFVDKKNGVIWVGTWGGGLNRFDPVTETFSRYGNDNDNVNSISHDHLSIGTITQDHLGQLWIGTSGGGLNRFNPKSGKFTRYQHDPNDINTISSDRINAVVVGSRGSDIWVGTDNGLNRMDIETGKFYRYQHNPKNKNSISDNDISTLFQSNTSKNQTLWIGSVKGLDKFETESGRFTHYPLNDPQLVSAKINAISEDEKGGLWITTNGSGVLYFEKGPAKFTGYRYQPENPNSITNDVVYPIFRDRDGGYWIGTWGGGVNRFAPDAQKFVNYHHESNRPDSIAHSAVFTIHHSRNGNLWIGTWGGGLSLFHPGTGTFTNYRHDPTNPNSLADNKVAAIFEDRDGIVWIGTWTAGLDRLDPRSGLFTHYQHDDNHPNTLSDNRVLAIVAGEDRHLWVGTSGNGLNKFDKTSGNVRRYFEDLNEPEKTLLSIKTDSDGILWIGTANGLVRFDPVSGNTKRYKHNDQNSSSISNNFVKTIYQDNNGQLWIGTNFGLNKFDRKSENFQRYFTKDGIANNRISGIIEDDQGNLWISTGHGISRLDRQRRFFLNYDQEDGLQANLFYYKAAARNQDGTLLFGGPNGLSVFHPQQIPIDTSNPAVVITDFQVDHQSWKRIGTSPLDQHINYTNNIVLPHTHSRIAFEFAALNYAAPNKHRYAYRLSGFDQEWHYVNSYRRFASYTNLDPGHYSFQVKAANGDQIWSENATTLTLIVTPPWWQTLWFRAVALAMTVFLLISGYRWRLKSIKRYNRHLKQLVDERTEKLTSQTTALSLINKELEAAKASSELANQAKSTFLTRMSHELRTPLNGILGYVQMLKSDKTLMNSKKARNGIETIENSGTHLLNLINEILDLSKIEASKMEINPAPIALNDFLASIIAMINAPATQKGLVISLKKSKRLPDQIIADEKRLRQVLLNMLSNAVKFTDQGAITLRVMLLDKNNDRVKLRFEVNDTGCGIPKNELNNIFSPFKQLETRDHGAEGTGLGLAISRKLLKLMQSELNVESMVGVGTTFWFELNLSELSVSNKNPTDHIDNQLQEALIEKPLVVPDPDQLTSLYQLADDGDFIALNARLAILQKKNDRYAPFVDKIRNLAKTFEDAEICDYIRSLLLESEISNSSR